ncbi:MAG: EthD domain-containing protein [Chromatiaceae bacterium]|jgi:hypothetical protein|nr:EthD domain-containing protein [Chromatiaceae bacterium]
MIRFIQCVRRKPGLPVDEFRRHWQAYQKALEELAGVSDARRMTVGFGLEIPHNSAIQEMRGTLEPFDAVLEVWWDSGAAIARQEDRPEIQERLAAIRAMQVQFMDLHASSFFFASEETDKVLE